MTSRRIGAALVGLGLLAAACGGGTATKALSTSSTSTSLAAVGSSTSSTPSSVAPSSSTTAPPLKATSPAPGAPKTNSPSGITVTGGATTTSSTAAQSGSSTSTTAQSTTTTQAAKTATIIIQNFAFSPATLNISVGTKVTVINKDSATHTWTADDGTFDSGNLAQNQSYTFTFTKAGTFPYHCAVHPYMTGTVQVS